LRKSIVRRYRAYFVLIMAVLMAALALHYSYSALISTSDSTDVSSNLSQIIIAANTPVSLYNIPHYCGTPQTCGEYHWHLHLDIFVNNTAYVVIPSNLGHINNSEYNLYAIHTHDYSGIIHIECCTPKVNQTFTLGQIFEIWGYPILDNLDCLTYHGVPVSVYVDGRQVQGDFASIPLTNHLEVVILIGSSHPTIPSNYTFPNGF
jgi:hypothetical protein